MLHFRDAPVPVVPLPGVGARLAPLSGLYFLGMACLFAALFAIGRELTRGGGFVFYAIPSLQLKVHMSELAEAELRQSFQELERVENLTTLRDLIYKKADILANLDGMPAYQAVRQNDLATWIEPRWMAVSAFVG